MGPFYLAREVVGSFEPSGSTKRSLIAWDADASGCVSGPSPREGCRRRPKARPAQSLPSDPRWVLFIWREKWRAHSNPLVRPSDAITDRLGKRSVLSRVSVEANLQVMPELKRAVLSRVSVEANLQVMPELQFFQLRLRSLALRGMPDWPQGKAGTKPTVQSRTK